MIVQEKEINPDIDGKISFSVKLLLPEEKGSMDHIEEKALPEEEASEDGEELGAEDLEELELSITKEIHERLIDYSFPRERLENIAEKEAKSIDSGAIYTGTKSHDLGELFSQHTVEITFKNTEWYNLGEYAKRIRGSSPRMFFSEVEISPKYRSGTYEVQSYHAIFHVSSIELKEK